MDPNFREEAYSLIELLLVVAIVISLFTVLIPCLTFLNKLVLQNEIDKMFTSFSFLQQRAIASNEKQEIIFDLDQNSYSYKLNDNKYSLHKLPAIIKFGFIKNSYGPPSSPTKKIVSAITFKTIGKNNKKHNVIFEVDGKIESGAIYLVDRDYNFMMAITTPISQISLIRKYRYDGRKWICLK